jgi:MFS superfamily sulfate permease-like transporter
MGYALLGGVSPIIGLYMAFFPVLIYVCLGTSHHISIGRNKFTQWGKNQTNLNLKFAK